MNKIKKKIIKRSDTTYSDEFKFQEGPASTNLIQQGSQE